MGIDNTTRRMKDPAEQMLLLGESMITGSPASFIENQERQGQRQLLPDGWTRQGSDHAMWSHLLDQHGRKRVSIFYKAAFYDRGAFMNLETLWSYTCQHVEYGEPLHIDSEWATRDAVLAAMREHLEDEQSTAAGWRNRAGEESRDLGSRERCAEWAAEAEANAAKYEAAIAALEAGAGRV